MSYEFPWNKISQYLEKETAMIDIIQQYIPIQMVIDIDQYQPELHANKNTHITLHGSIKSTDKWSSSVTSDSMSMIHTDIPTVEFVMKKSTCLQSLHVSFSRPWSVQQTAFVGSLKTLDIDNIMLNKELLYAISQLPVLEFFRINGSHSSEDFHPMTTQSPHISPHHHKPLSTRNYKFLSHYVRHIEIHDSVLSSDTREIVSLLILGISNESKLSHLTLPWLGELEIEYLSTKKILSNLKHLHIYDFQPENNQPSSTINFLQCFLSSIEVIVLHANKELNIHMDFILSALVRGVQLPGNLEIFEIKIHMDQNLEYFLPCNTLEWCVYFRCKFKNSHKFFKRSVFGVEMKRNISKDIEIASPEELFILEMDAGNGNSWTETLSQSRRMDYVDIFDSIIEERQKAMIKIEQEALLMKTVLQKEGGEGGDSRSTREPSTRIKEDTAVDRSEHRYRH
jgi:hypothetical protein